MNTLIKTFRNSILGLGFTIILFGITSNTHAQWATNGANINNTNTGNVGIGVAAPNFPLHVNKTGVGVVLQLTNNTTGSTSGDGMIFSFSGAGSPYNNNVQIINNEARDIEFLIDGDANGLSQSDEKMRITRAGNFGIGVMSPGVKLHIQQGNPTGLGGFLANQDTVGIDSDQGYNFVTFRGSSAQAQGLLFGDDVRGTGNIVYYHNGDSLTFGTGNGVEKMRITSSGNVGIGIANPVELLHVKASGTNSAAIDLQSGNGREWKLSAGNSAVSSRFDIKDASVGLERFSIDFNGNIGIGIVNPLERLHVKASGTNSAAIDLQSGNGREWKLSAGNSAVSSRFDIKDASVGLERLSIDFNGNVGIGVTNPSQKIDVQGNARVRGDIIVDGNLAAKYQDVAEWVPSKKALSAGTVVVLDTMNDDHVTPSMKAYDTRVAGVVSTHPGLILGEAADNKSAVATTGRVKAHVTSKNGAIHRGDILVTSDVPGTAMRSTPIDVGGAQMHRPGTVVGKALEPLEKGDGEIMVLLTLQ